jgi:hypothetical protein
MGEFAPFAKYCDDIARTETRGFIISRRRKKSDLPHGGYTLLESYCTDKSCDCRKVMINIFSKRHQQIITTIGYGWENEQFYIDWMHGDEEMGRDMAGAYLEVGGIQSQYSHACLRFFREEILVHDPSYVDLLKQHCKAFKERLPDKIPDDEEF